MRQALCIDGPRDGEVVYLNGNILTVPVVRPLTLESVLKAPEVEPPNQFTYRAQPVRFEQSTRWVLVPAIWPEEVTMARILTRLFAGYRKPKDDGA